MPDQKPTPDEETEGSGGSGENTEDTTKPGEGGGNTAPPEPGSGNEGNSDTEPTKKPLDEEDKNDAGV